MKNGNYPSGVTSAVVFLSIWLRLGRALVDQYCGAFRTVPKRIVLDIDDTFDRVHGAQQLRLFNA
jgi:hypothetical protein